MKSPSAPHRLCALSALALALVVLLAATPAQAVVTLTQNLIIVKTRAQGGGAATPVNDPGPGGSETTDVTDNTLLGSSASGSSFASGDARNGAGDLLGFAEGSSSASASTSVDIGTATITGSFSANATSDQSGSGTAAGFADVFVELLFTLDTATDYTYSSSLTGDTESPDEADFRRILPTLSFISLNNSGTGFADVVGQTGTLTAGSYRLRFDVNANEAATASSSETVGGSFSLAFEAGTTIIPEPSRALLGLLGFAAIGLRRRRA